MIYIAFSIEALTIGWLVFVCFRVSGMLKKQSARIDALFAAIQATRSEVVATPELIATWKAGMQAAPVGSPRHTAYKNRLIEIGSIDKTS